MNRHDRKAWASAQTMADLGERVVAWLNGDLTETPGHMGVPDDETIPLIFTLSLINRSGFVTDNSQLAETRDGNTWGAWVAGFASDRILARIRAAAEGTPLSVAACRGSAHECGAQRLTWCPSFLRPCPGRGARGFWADRCPAVAGELRGAWYVTVADPEPGRNDVLWPVLRDALCTEVAW